MNWLLKFLGYRDREYRGPDFSVRIEQIMREAVSVVYTSHGASLNLSGERIGKKWEGIQVQIPTEVEASLVQQIVCDLETAFSAMQYGYVIMRRVGTDVVPEAEQQATIAELNEMGYEIEILPDRNIRQTRRPGAPRHDLATLRKQAPRMVALIQSLGETRHRFETLAKSKEF